MKGLSLLRRRAPHLFLALRTIHYALRRERLDPGTASIARALCGEHLHVLSGPFADMKYLPTASGSGLLPKLAGTYELEIQPAIETALKRDYRSVINIGCGEGYYAVGFALHLPGVQVHAFDIDIVARQRARRLTRTNGVAERLAVRGPCTSADLRRLCGSYSLLVCDCEGCESRLLDPEAAPQLADTDMLVELHEFVVPGVSACLRRRFETTHECEMFEMVSRAHIESPVLDRLSRHQRDLAVWEGRPPGMSWAWFRSKTGEARS